MTAIEQASAVRQVEPGRFLAEVPASWQQGRGAFGGLVLAILARALEQTEPDPARRMRTLSGEICGPVQPGPAEVRVSVLRRGKYLTNLDAQLFQQGEVLARASAIISTARPVQSALPAPTPPPGAGADWRAVEAPEVGPPLGPEFAQHYEYRSTSPWPFSGAPEAACHGWISERERPARLDVASLTGRLDAWWPAFLVTASEPRATATISFMAEFLADPATLSTEPFYYHGRVVALEEGFFVELRELWQGERLVALNQQTFAVLL